MSTQGPDLADAFDVAQCAFLVLDADERVTLCNAWLADLFGQTPEDLLGAAWVDRYICPEDQEPARRTLAALRRGGLPRQQTLTHLRSDATRLRLHWRHAALPDGSGTLSSGVVSSAGRALRTSQLALEQIKHALDQSAIVARTDRRGRIDFVNDKFCEISQYPREELIGQDHRLVNSGHHSRDFFKNLWGTIGRGQPWRGEIQNRTKGGNLYWVDTTIVPLHDADGRIEHYLSIRYDITERKRQEEVLRRQESLAAVGQMAAVVAHEIKNPLMGIGGALQVIAGRLPQGGQIEQKILGDIQARIRSLNESLDELLEFTRPRPPEPRSFDLLELLERSRSILASDPRSASCVLEVHSESIQVMADPDLVGRGLYNVLLNAVQALEGRPDGRVVVTARAGEAWCVVEVRDNGPGIPEEVRSRVFEPFFSTRPKGTGLGMAIVQRMAEDHGGDLTLECPADGGTLVTLTLPVRRPS